VTIEIPTRCAVCKTTHRPSERPHGIALAAQARQRQLARELRAGLRAPYRRQSRKPLREHPAVWRMAVRWRNEQRFRGVPADEEAFSYALMLLRDPCAYCGSRDDITIDHIVTVALGGLSGWDNLAAVCRGCNSRKRHRSVLQTVHRIQYQIRSRIPLMERLPLEVA
jgi:5-methylcytosine-specific restriction endonuclease McrA